MADDDAPGDWLAAGMAHLAFALFGALPPKAASALGGALGQALGPLVLGRADRTARRNLDRFLGQLPAAERARIRAGVWQSLGRLLAEYPHLDRLWAERVELVGAGNLAALRDDGRPGLIYLAHLGNWELLTRLPAAGPALTIAYRAPNNRRLRGLLARARMAPGTAWAPKGAAGARVLIETLAAGGHAALLVDQKMNDGIAVPLFGVPAMTAPAVAQLARRFAAPLAGLRIERLPDLRFRLTIGPPWDVAHSTDREADIAQAMQRINAEIETWVRARPDQWLWTHNRWPEPARDDAR